MDITLTHTFVFVDDQDKALEFYRDLLGLEIRNDVKFDTMRWLAIGSPNQPDVEIVLIGTDQSYVAPDKDTLNALLAKGTMTACVFRVDDVDALYDKVKASGAEIQQEPFSQAYGVRDCAFRDPAGNSVRFSQVLAA